MLYMGAGTARDSRTAEGLKWRTGAPLLFSQVPRNVVIRTVPSRTCPSPSLCGPPIQVPAFLCLIERAVPHPCAGPRAALLQPPYGHHERLAVCRGCQPDGRGRPVCRDNCCRRRSRHALVSVNLPPSLPPLTSHLQASLPLSRSHRRSCYLVIITVPPAVPKSKGLCVSPKRAFPLIG